ncbi:TNF receptor-associated factor homolog 1a-like [Lolium rigidum]|uniref:TNF receptor-associated factor homolog 1a-like n=1 Tax=Lolium rigidum TaxID=89674 RepID=UPI001F5D984A|nr:TNF receptor-associated factor homolog 1a-like [Lolium rigidum]
MLIDDSVGSTAELGDEDRSVSGDSLSEWRSCDQVDNGSPSTSPPFWDTDGEDDDPGPGPSSLFGRHTWRIANFSKEKKREMKSEPFEAGGFKWYILVYPQGCDVSNHLSLFLCVANHDKHLPGWSQFAQFTIAVGNLDPKKVKYSDTLHKFWKKEHDWGWKKFMELSKIQDGFLVDDVLEIIAQVQVIREKVDRPFRCLDRLYRRELLRVYMTNIEQIYRRSVEEHRSKLTKLTEDKMRWSSFRAFWLAIDPSTRHRMSREKSDVILKIIVKHFFVEKEVTSTLVMDSLHTGLKALEHQCRGKKSRGKLMDSEESPLSPAPMVHVDMDMFVLAGDVLALLERAALEPLPCQPLSPKDDKCSQSRTKDGSSGEVKVSIEHEEKRLTEFGQKILETFVLSHIFSGIEVAYQEAVALKRQEELIREEEEAGLLESEMKGKRSITEKEKRAKKKQAKQKKNNRKIKDKDREEKFDSTFPEKDKDDSTIHDMEDSKQAGQVDMKVDTSEEGASDMSDNFDGSAEVCQTDAGDKILQPLGGMNVVGIETENMSTGKNCIVESNLSSCSSESATMNIMQGKRDNLPAGSSQILPCLRGKAQRTRVISSMDSAKHDDDLPSSTATGSDRNTSGCGPAPKLDHETVLLTLKDRLQKLGQRLHEKEIEGRKLLKAHLEKKAAAEAASSSSSSSSLEKTPGGLKNPEQHSVTSPDACTYAPPRRSQSVATDGALPAKQNTRISIESGPIVAPTPNKVVPALGKEHVSSLKLKTDRATPVTSRSLSVDKAATLTTSSSLVNKAIPAPSESPAARVAKAAKPIPAPLKSSAPQADKVTKATPVPPNPPAPHVEKVAKAIPVLPKPPASQVEKVAKAIPVLPKSPAPQIDKVVSLNAVPRQWPPLSNSEPRKVSVPKKIVVTSVPRTPAASRSLIAPLFQAPRATLSSTPAVQVPPLQSRSFTVSRRASNEPSPPVPSYVPQTYRNAIIGNGGLDTTLSSHDKVTSLGQSNTLSEPLSAYASATSVMLPPVGRNGQLPGNQGFMSGHGKLDTLDNWHPWKGDSDANKHMWRNDTPYQQLNGDAHIHPWNDNLYQQASNRETEEQGRFGGIQHRQFQREIPTNFVSHQLQGLVGEEFPHLDIINDLLEEEQSKVSMAEPPIHEYRTFGLPFSPSGNLVEADIASLSNSGRLNLTDHYYEGYPGAYDMPNAIHRPREGHFSTSNAYSNGMVDSISSKPWLYSYPNPVVNPGINSNGYTQQMGDYTNYASGRVHEEYLYRRADGRW